MTSSQPIFKGRIDIVVCRDLGDELYLPKIQEILRNTEHTVLAPASNPVEIGLKKPSLLVKVNEVPENLRARGISRITITLYHFGDIAVRYEADVSGDFSSLLAMANSVGDTVSIARSDAELRASRVLEVIQLHVREPLHSSLFEDYVVYDLTTDYKDVQSWCRSSRAQIAQLLVSVNQTPSIPTSEGLFERAIERFDRDLTVVGWNSALLINVENSRAVPLIEMANAQLLATRVLNDAIGREADRAFAKLEEPWWKTQALAEVSDYHGQRLYLFDDLKHALNVLRDEYLALLYKKLTQAFRIAEEEESIRSSLEVIENVADRRFQLSSTRRSEILMIIELLLSVLISALIVYEIVHSGKV